MCINLRIDCVTWKASSFWLFWANGVDLRRKKMNASHQWMGCPLCTHSQTLDHGAWSGVCSQSFHLKLHPEPKLWKIMQLFECTCDGINYMYLQPTCFQPANSFPKRLIQHFSREISTWELCIGELELREKTPNHEDHHCLGKLRWTLRVRRDIALWKGPLKLQQMLIDIAKVAKPNHLSCVLIKDNILPDMHLIQKQDDIFFTLWTGSQVGSIHKHLIHLTWKPCSSLDIVSIISEGALAW